MKFDKKAVTGIVVVSLLLVVSVLTVFELKGWFVLYQDNFELQMTAKDFDANVEIMKIDGTNLYLKNDFKDDLSVSQIKIDDKVCNLAENLTVDMGTAIIDIRDCTYGFQDMTVYDVSLSSESGIISEGEILRNIIDSLLIINFQTTSCDFSSGYVRLYGLSNLDNAHVEVSNSNLFTYNVCAKHINYDLGTASSGNFVNLFYLTEQNNSAIWTSKGSIHEWPNQWFNISISSSGGVFDYVVNSSDMSSLNYTCIGRIDLDDTYGSHVGDCSSSLSDILWLKLE